MRSEIVVGGENGKEPTEPSVLMLQNMAVHHHHHHHQDPCSRSVIIHPPSHHQVVQQQMVNDVVHPPVSAMFAPPLPIQNERREFREPELDIGSFFLNLKFKLNSVCEMEEVIRRTRSGR
jgi:hypothetical protein